MAVPAEMPVPPGVVGHDPNYRSLNQHDPDLANRLLDRFGYTRGADGYRRMPDGKPLVIRYATSGSVVDREHNELWRKSLDAIGVRIEFDTAPFVENLKAAKACKLMMWESSWSADYPDGDNFMQLLYGPNIGPEQQRLLRVEGVRRVLREVARAAGFARAQPAVPRDVAADGSGRRVEPAPVARAQAAAAPLGEGIQEASDPAARSGSTWTSSRDAGGRLPAWTARCAASPRCSRWSRCWAPAAAQAADPRKVFRDVFPVAETGFDPAAINDLYSAGIVRAIFETLYTYDYLARPAKLVPQVADGMPAITDDGRTYTVRLAKGIHFAADPAFGGKKRELTADDVVYSYKRVADPRIRSPYAFLIDGKFVGLDDEVAAAKKSGRFDYDRKVAGLEVVDRYTVRFRLTGTDYNLPYVHGARGPVARRARGRREVRGDRTAACTSNPVGTGPYRLGQWVRSSKIVLEANADYRGFVWDFAPAQPGDDKLVAQMKGKRMPQVGRVEIAVMEEDQARWLAFQDGELDTMNMEGPLAPNAIGPDGKVTPALAAKGVRVDRFVDPEIRYIYWNMLDPRVGGLAKEQIALRRALAMSYDVDEEIRVVRNGQAVEAAYPIPPGVVGHVADWKSTIKYDPAAANALLDRFGYKRGADGWRTWPDGKPMVIKYASRPETHGRQLEELVKKAYDAIGVRMEGQKERFPEQLKLEKQCRLFSRRPRGSRTIRTATTSCSSSTGPTRTRATPGARRFRSTTRCTGGR